MEVHCNMETGDIGITDQMREAFGAIMPMLDKSLSLTPNPRRSKAPRRGDTNPEDEGQQATQQQEIKHMMQMMQLMAQMVVKQDQEWNSLRRTDQFILFLNPDPQGALHQLVQETAQWKLQMENSSKSQMKPLRQHLILTLLQALHTNAGKIVESKETEPLHQTSVQKGLILADKSFPFHRWDAHTQKLMIDKKQPVSSQKMFQHLTELQEMVLDRDLVVRFHALKAVSDKDLKAVPWRLQINLRNNRAYELLLQLCHNAVWMAVGATLKPHSLGQSTMATNLQAMLHKPQGKGKGKHQAKLSPKKES
jgi:hypothetical protein